MMQSLWLLAGAGFAIWTARLLSSWSSNLAKAKASGLPYFIAPCSPWNRLWQMSGKFAVPMIRSLPKPWWENWLPPMSPDYSYNSGHNHFSRVGDTFLLVAPSALFIFTDNAEAITKITTRREDFPKFTEIYDTLSQFGDNILTTEGQTWRMHRKITSSSFNEKNAALVFREAIGQTQGMLTYWQDNESSDKGTDSRGTLLSLDHDTMRLALNIIGYVGFGLRLPWPGQKVDVDPVSQKYGSLTPPEGHTLSFVDTMATLLENIILVLIFPVWLLKKLPWEKTRQAGESHTNFGSYMNELLDEKIDEAQKGRRTEGMDLMGELAKSSFGVNSGSKSATLSRDEIIGNALIMLVAGHETSAGTLHFTLVQLATNPAAQRKLQKELDEMVGATDPKDWDYESLVNPMMSSMLAASMNETLRLLPPVCEIPKIVTPSQDQTLTIDGNTYSMPAGAAISLCVASASVNPRYWPGRPSKVNPGADDVTDWVPERWFRTDEAKAGLESGSDEEDFGGYKGPDTSAALFNPVRGAFIPFSTGARSCLGRRIAQVEMIAALAVVFREYSVELAVDDWATDEQVSDMGREQKEELYSKAQSASRAAMRTASSILTLKMHEEKVSLRLVKRGEERFVNWAN